MEHCGVRITGTYIVSINNDYVYDGKLDLERLFQITDVSEFVRNEIGEVEKNLLQEESSTARLSKFLMRPMLNMYMMDLWLLVQNWLWRL